MTCYQVTTPSGGLAAEAALACARQLRGGKPASQRGSRGMQPGLPDREKRTKRKNERTNERLQEQIKP